MSAKRRRSASGPWANFRIRPIADTTATWNWIDMKSANLAIPLLIFGAALVALPVLAYVGHHFFTMGLPTSFERPAIIGSAGLALVCVGLWMLRNGSSRSNRDSR